MMLHPKKTKFRKAFKGRIHGKAKGGFKIAFGKYALKALEPERIQEKQIEAARKAITRHLKRVGKLWIRIFPDVPVSRKPADVRMGRGKGSPEFWACRVKPGRILFELDSVTEEQAMGAFERASAKLPIKTKFVKNIEEVI
ncbi:50S ribosomal protein L16 [Candidatus Bandiella woodruffii]|uniref:Large ribosomal subunit protein uL16 n=2 Tax=Candidatus Bandiella euplotis TaxID=1664265 RepID=A0ABZ0UKW0_9RICK|nr:50S ribosomal protein L16 [Candidatus Bandiella woodruffii]